MQGIPSPPSSPPLAALTSANELALIKKTPSSRRRETDGSRKKRRGGATYHIRGECERLFCETMHTVFSGEERKAGAGSIVMGMNGQSPPEEVVFGQQQQFQVAGRNYFGHTIDAWLEIWDYTGGCSFRGFVGGNADTKSLFAFFDSAVVGTDLKQGYVLSFPFRSFGG